MRIGMFDSGVGGLSVWKSVRCLFPLSDIIYVADNLHCPYGNRSQQEIIRLCELITDFLIAEGCDVIVVACNTATSAAIAHLRETYQIPFVGMEPAIKPAAQSSNTGVVGVLATKGTLAGRLFIETTNKFATNVEVLTQVGEGLVELVEYGKERSPEAYALVRKYVQPMLDRGVDRIVLGCTHYPFLADTIQDIVGADVELLDPAPAVAKRLTQLKDSWESSEHQGSGINMFYATGEPSSLRRMVSSILGKQIEPLPLVLS